MQQIKQQIYSHITSNQVRNYLNENIFNTSLLVNEPYSSHFITKDSGFIKNLSNPSSSMMMSSFMKNNSFNDAKLSIKELIKRIEGLIVMEGFWKNVQDINMMRKKIEQLKKENLKMEMKLAQKKLRLKTQAYSQGKISSKQSKFNTQIFRQDSHKKYSQKLHKDSDLLSHINFDDQLMQAIQKLSYEKTKQSLISIAKLSKDQKNTLIAKTRKQYESILRHISTIQKVIENIQMLHPDEAALKLQVEQLQRELDHKSMIIAADQRLDVEIQKLKKKIQTIRKENPQIFLQRNDHYQHIQKKQSHQNKFQQKKHQLSQKLIKFSQFIKQEQIQKYQLVKEIKSFNILFEKEKKLNEDLFNKIKQNFYQYPALIDQVLKINKQDKNKIQFLLNRLQLNFQ